MRMHLQMIESSDHGDEYDGVIFSQLVCSIQLILSGNQIFFLAALLFLMLVLALFLEFD